MNANPPDWDGYSDPTPPPLPPTASSEEGQKTDADKSPGIKGHWNERMTSFQKLIMVKAFREEVVSERVIDGLGDMS